MKKFIIILLLLEVSFSYSQMCIAFNNNIDFYKPYTESAQEYLKNQKVKSNTLTFQTLFPIWKIENYTFKLGISYKNISLRNIDMASQIGYISDFNPNNGYYIFSANIDLVNRSHSLGIPFSVDRCLFFNEKKRMEIGAQIDVYCTEYFRVKFDRKDKKKIDYEPYNKGSLTLFSPVASQLTIFSTYKYAYNNRSSIGIRLQAGTNLYSNWDQFKRYAWLGVGLEWEIGKKVKN